MATTDNNTMIEDLFYAENLLGTRSQILTNLNEISICLVQSLSAPRKHSNLQCMNTIASKTCLNIEMETPWNR